MHKIMNIQVMSLNMHKIEFKKQVSGQWLMVGIECILLFSLLL